MTDLTGRVALVTGSSSGIGEASARHLADAGASVVVNSASSVEAGEAVSRSLATESFYHQADISSKEQCQGMVDAVLERFGRLDILVNNAGHDAGGRRRLDLGEVEDWADIIDTNVTGMVRVTHAVAPGMVARRRGHIVNLGSIAGLRAYPGGPIYAATKFAVRGLSDALRMDYAEHGIRVSEVLPGTARTEFALRRWAGDAARADAFYDGYPDLLTAEDVARCVIFALDQPPEVTIAKIVVIPRSQAI